MIKFFMLKRGIIQDIDAKNRRESLEIIISIHIKFDKIFESTSMS